MKNVREERRFKENLTILKKRLLKKIGSNLTINTNQSSTISSPRNESRPFYKKGKDFAALYKLTYIDFNSLDLEQTSEKKKTRIDNFGQEIKKGGRHKIAFADELYLLNTVDLGKEKKKGNKNKRRNSFPKCKEENKNEKLKEIKRSNSYDISRWYLVKHFYNIYNINNLKEKPKKFINLDVIDFESTKKENKLNTYLIRKNIAIPDEDNVCCSCYCSIY